MPENRAKPDARAIELAFLRMKTRSEKPLAPVVYLAGGPGAAATSGASAPEAVQSWLDLLERHDVILLDQRGTGSSRPNLEALRAAGSSTPRFVPLSGAHPTLSHPCVEEAR